MGGGGGGLGGIGKAISGAASNAMKNMPKLTSPNVDISQLPQITTMRPSAPMPPDAGGGTSLAQSIMQFLQA
jgi:hypothetical protein